MCSRDVDVQSAAVTYAADLPSPELLHCEMERWKQRYMNHKAEDRPSSPAKAIKDCDRDCFPNVYILLQIACTIPVTSCECERSASALRRLNNYIRASMGQTRCLTWHFFTFTMTLQSILKKLLIYMLGCIRVGLN